MKIFTPRPRPAPFKVGTKLKYLGDHESHQIIDGKRIPWLIPNMIVEVIREDYGHQGTGREIGTDDEGDLIFDETRDFVSVTVNEFGLKRLIHRKDKNDWEII